ncbi:MAG TPA: dihydroorotate dehydrogenase-like protein [Actinomycetes bacterium]|nr:dihydroorotate dehydrogenase-like protein [Actinomycetes bacterium]
MTGDLHTSYLGLELRSPLVASASPLTGELDSLRRLEAAGVGAVVLPSLFEEQLTHDQLELDQLLETTSDHTGEAQSYFPDLEDYNTGPWTYLDHITQAKRALSVPVIASLNGVTPGGWVRHAKRMGDAGADAIELNLYTVATDPQVGGAELERRYLDLVAEVRAAVSLPLAVKLSPYFTALANFAVRVEEAGADGLVLFNRFYQPDLDLDSRDVTPRLVLSSSEELRLPLRWIAILFGRVGTSLAATTGVHTGLDAAKVLLAGADVAMMTSALLRNGPEHVGVVERELRAVMAERDYDSVAQLRGSMSHDAMPDPAGFERANYMRTLMSWSSQHQVSPGQAADPDPAPPTGHTAR